jgi:hypothetical protein
MATTATSRQVAYINSLLDGAVADRKADEALRLYNQITGADEANVGSAKGSGTGLRKRLGRLSASTASTLIDALREL